MQHKRNIKKLDCPQEIYPDMRQILVQKFEEDMKENLKRRQKTRHEEGDESPETDKRLLKNCAVGEDKSTNYINMAKKIFDDIYNYQTMEEIRFQKQQDEDTINDIAD